MRYREGAGVLRTLERHIGWVFGGISEWLGVYLELGLLQSRGWMLPSVLVGCVVLRSVP